MKVARTVWSGGKGGGNFKALPIAIERGRDPESGRHRGVGAACWGRSYRRHRLPRPRHHRGGPLRQHETAGIYEWLRKIDDCFSRFKRIYLIFRIWPCSLKTDELIFWVHDNDRFVETLFGSRSYKLLFDWRFFWSGHDWRREPSLFEKLKWTF